MPDLLTNVLKVNQPMNNGFDNNTVRNNPTIPGETQIKNVADPSKVVQADGKQEPEEGSFKFLAESNYGKFVQMLQTTPELTELFSKLFLFDSQQVVVSGLGESFAEQLSAFMEMIAMDEGQLLTFLTSQASAAGKFSGALFQALRSVLSGTSSVELRTSILEFLKQYGDMSSSDHVLKNIMTQLQQMERYMFKSDSEEFLDITGRLQLSQDGQGQETAGGQLDARIAENSRIFKEELIPFFSRYISKTHDLGKIRDLMTMTTLHISRYMNGTRQSVMESFEKLFRFQDFIGRLGQIGEDNIETVINRMMTEQKDSGQNLWTEKFVSLLKSGLAGEGGFESKAVFQNILNAMLLGESVYMPLIHVMLPVTLNGQQMFSEVWVDPDASGGQGPEREEEQSIRMLIKFDIKNLGFFDVVLDYHMGDVNLLVACPPRLLSQEKSIRDGIGKIVAENGLSFKSLILSKEAAPLPLMDVFPKISKGRNSINVRV